MNCCIGDLKLVHKLAEANLEFAINLYQIYKDTECERGNILLSPFSISISLAMTWLGSRHDTASQLYEALQFELLSQDNEEIHRAFKKVIKTVRTKSEIDSSTQCSLQWVNKIYLDENYQTATEFSDTLSSCYSSSVGQVSLRDNLETTCEHINEWIKEATQNKVLNLLPHNLLTPSTRIIVVNAIYFKGVWSHRFDPDKFRPGSFFKKRFEKPIPVMMMEIRAALLYHIDYDFKCRVVELPYAQSHLKMLVFLPFDVEGLPTLERKFNPSLINYLRQHLTKATVTVIMPQLKLNASVSLRHSLQAMGVTDLFDNSKADLSGMTGTTDIHYFDVIHNVFLDTNDGDRTVHYKVDVDHPNSSSRRLQELNQLTFLADHPFFFIIYDKTTNMIVFLGRYVDPVLYNSMHVPSKSSPHHAPHHN